MFLYFLNRQFRKGFYQDDDIVKKINGIVIFLEKCLDSLRTLLNMENLFIECWILVNNRLLDLLPVHFLSILIDSTIKKYAIQTDKKLKVS